ncbi:radical SAM protein [uncultured Methanobrevibacter sp.]|uniref:SPL family radical SAM protein n=1 Tax=uncultured Methanobrevibacter sp. TaxID=253161 RepID=UPI00341B7B46
MGCSFNCVYCYINGSKYAKETNNYYVKSNASDLVYKKLKKLAKNQERAFLNLGSASDSYMEIEKELELTRDILKIFLRFKYPVHIITKSDLILRDIDILRKINEIAILPEDIKNLKSKVCITFSFSTIDDELASLIEPNAPLPSQRLNAMNKLASEGFHVGVALMPILPYLNDDIENLDNAVKLFKKNNASYLILGALSLFGNNDNSSKIKYFNFIENNFPEILVNVKKLFYNREYPSQKYQNDIYRKIVNICKKQDVKTTMI